MATITMTAYEYATRTGQTLETALAELHQYDSDGSLVAINAATLGGQKQYDIDTTIIPDNDGTFLA